MSLTLSSTVCDKDLVLESVLQKLLQCLLALRCEMSLSCEWHCSKLSEALASTT